MFYRPGEQDPKADLGLSHNPFKALVQPRPIGWISSRSADGRDNLAPYSFFNALSDAPPLVMFSANGSPHSIRNARETGFFAVNMVSKTLFHAMNETATSDDVDEFERAGLDKAECETIPVSRVAIAPATFECKVERIVELPGKANTMAIGEVIGIHIDDQIIKDGKVSNWFALARLGYMDYTAVQDVFSKSRPG
ncbi:MAG: flavin reductase family protein [Alphaproteobacteria bacterium]|nr:flavin reductase family protein [Alphaproteobacteria bacterium SS10]